MEITHVSLLEDKLVFSRGYLIGPYLPIFGFGAIFLIGYLERYQEDVFALFCFSFMICCLLEYFTSLLMEKIFHLRWWDYSNKKFNINGRICLENGFYFGLGGVLLMKYIHPWILGIVSSFPIYLVYFLGCFLFIIMFTDFIISTSITLKLKVDVRMYQNKDATKVVREEIRKSFMKHSIFRTRVLDAFPGIREGESKIKLRDIIDKINDK